MRKRVAVISKDADVGLGAEISHRLPPLKALTSLRFFAAIYVAVYHLAAGHSLLRWTPAENFIASGDTGVSLFFILSGFILAYNYRGVGRPKQFWISRFARIYPVYLFALLAGVAYSFAPASPSDAHPWLRFVLTAVLLQSWYQPFSDSFNPPGWTLSVEAFFYALFPFVIKGIARVSGRVFAFFCAGYIACLCVPIALLAAAHAVQATACAAFLAGSRSPVVHLPLFLIGARLGVSFGTKPSVVTRAGRHQSLWWSSRWSPSVPYLAAAGSVALLCAGPSGVFEPLRRGLLCLCYAALIRGLAEVRRGPLTSRGMVLAGEISFSIYILQMPVFRTVFGVVRRMHPAPFTNIALALGTLISIAYLAYRFIELPARVAIRQWFTHRSVPLKKI